MFFRRVSACARHLPHPRAQGSTIVAGTRRSPGSAAPSPSTPPDGDQRRTTVGTRVSVDFAGKGAKNTDGAASFACRPPTPAAARACCGGSGILARSVLVAPERKRETSPSTPPRSTAPFDAAFYREFVRGRVRDTAESMAGPGAGRARRRSISRTSTRADGEAIPRPETSI